MKVIFKRFIQKEKNLIMRAVRIEKRITNRKSTEKFLFLTKLDSVTPENVIESSSKLVKVYKYDLEANLC